MSPSADDQHGSDATDGTAKVQVRTTATPEQVWAVLADGWSYAGWVVGASRIRVVEDGWPAVGTRVHHSVGGWPLLLDDDTVVLESRAPTHLVLQARGRPLGEARVALDIEASGDGALVTVREDATDGPGRLIPKPLRQLGVIPRNRESLRRLAYLAERGSR